MPLVAPPLVLAVALAALPEAETRLLLDPTGTETARSLQLAPDATVVLAVGPEGGWSPVDRMQLTEVGFIGLRLGPRVLRTETAGLAAIAALQARFGDLG